MALLAGFGLVFMAEPASAQRYGMYYSGYGRGYFGGAFPGYYGRPWGYGWGYPGYYGSSFTYPYSYGYSLYAPYNYTPYTTTGPTYYLPGGLTGPYPTAMRPNTGSAGIGRTDEHGHLVVRLPEADAEIRINGKHMTETGKTRRYVSGRIRPGKKRIYKVTARWEENGNEVERTKTVVLRTGQQRTIRFTEAMDQQKPAGRAAKPQGKGGARKTQMEKKQTEKKAGSKGPKKENSNRED
jgi:uncharacterized protein (TIGR03000 family)